MRQADVRYMGIRTPVRDSAAPYQALPDQPPEATGMAPAKVTGRDATSAETGMRERAGVRALTPAPAARGRTKTPAHSRQYSTLKVSHGETQKGYIPK